MRVEDLESWHLNAIDIQDEQSWIEEHIVDKDKHARIMVDAGPAFALIDGDRVLGCAGVWVLEAHRVIAWAVIDRNIGSDYIHYHKEVLKHLDKHNYQRVEMAVEVNFKQAKRWAIMLGFKQEGLMHRYFANGADAFLYARIR